MSISSLKCPVCRSGKFSKFFDGGNQPLATLGWPSSREHAQMMDAFPLEYVQCLDCSHVWNLRFDYDVIPYQNNPNRMYNIGSNWKGYISKTLLDICAYLPSAPTVIDIGCGEGHFVRDLAHQLDNQGEFLGFDPNSSSESGAGINFHSKYFYPEHDLERYQPDLLIMRHVLEHLDDPADFLEKLAIASLKLEKPVYFFGETPCVEKAIENFRIVDFFYEHPSQFSKRSFTRLLELGGELIWCEKGYGDEVVNGLVKLGLNKHAQSNLQGSKIFNNEAASRLSSVKNDLENIILSGDRVAVWGGTGKSATFINYYGMDQSKFSIVVDSDMDKVGTFVPGAGQEILPSSYLIEHRVDIILITTQWRAADIYKEIKAKEIAYKTILLEHNGRLIDYENVAHPYG